MLKRATSTNSKIMIEITKDKKSPSWIITKTDAEGFHHQIAVTIDELFELGNRCFMILEQETRVLRKIKFPIK